MPDGAPALHPHMTPRCHCCGKPIICMPVGSWICVICARAKYGPDCGKWPVIP
jgi:hypothetical protein